MKRIVVAALLLAIFLAGGCSGELKRWEATGAGIPIWQAVKLAAGRPVTQSIEQGTQAIGSTARDLGVPDDYNFTKPSPHGSTMLDWLNLAFRVSEVDQDPVTTARGEQETLLRRRRDLSLQETGVAD